MQPYHQRRKQAASIHNFLRPSPKPLPQITPTAMVVARKRKNENDELSDTKPVARRLTNHEDAHRFAKRARSDGQQQRVGSKITVRSRSRPQLPQANDTRHAVITPPRAPAQKPSAVLQTKRCLSIEAVKAIPAAELSRSPPSGSVSSGSADARRNYQPRTDALRNTCIRAAAHTKRMTSNRFPVKRTAGFTSSMPHADGTPTTVAQSESVIPGPAPASPVRAKLTPAAQKMLADLGVDKHLSRHQLPKFKKSQTVA